MERFTQRARRVLSFAHQEAEHTRKNYINTEHLLVGLMLEEGGVAGRVLRDLGMTTERIREVIERLTTPSGDFDPARVELGLETQKALEQAVEETRRLGHHYIGTEHILLGLVRVVNGVAMQVLDKLQINADMIRRQTRRVLNETVTELNVTSSGKVRKKYSQVFILHGENEWKKTVASLAQTLGLVPVILDSEYGSGTAMEYLDRNSNDVALGFAEK